MLDLPPAGTVSATKNTWKTQVLMRRIIILVAVMVIGGFAYAIWPDGSQNDQNSADAPVAGGAIAKVILPDTLTQNAQIGKRAFEINCASCHGVNAAGQEDIAPPLVHIIYEPNHHADESFQRAVALGVRAHHWPFGDMPAVEGLTRGDVTLITTYIRELQRANGIN